MQRADGHSPADPLRRYRMHGTFSEAPLGKLPRRRPLRRSGSILVILLRLRLRLSGPHNAIGLRNHLRGVRRRRSIRHLTACGWAVGRGTARSGGTIGHLAVRRSCAARIIAIAATATGAPAAPHRRRALFILDGFAATTIVALLHGASEVAASIAAIAALRRIAPPIAPVGVAASAATVGAATE
jgi:hypothetical protein